TNSHNRAGRQVLPFHFTENETERQSLRRTLHFGHCKAGSESRLLRPTRLSFLCLDYSWKGPGGHILGQPSPFTIQRAETPEKPSDLSEATRGVCGKVGGEIETPWSLLSLAGSFFPVHSPQGTLEEELSRSCRGPGPGRSGGGPQRPRIPEPVARPGRSCALPPPGAAGARSGRCLGLRFLAWGSLPSARSHAVLGTLRSTEPSLPQELSADSPPSGVSGATGGLFVGTLAERSSSDLRPTSSAAPFPGLPTFFLSPFSPPPFSLFITFVFLALTPSSFFSRCQPLSSSPLVHRILGLGEAELGWASPSPTRRLASLWVPCPCLLGKPPPRADCHLLALQAQRQDSAPGPAHLLGRCAGFRSLHLSVPLFSRPRVEGARSLESGVASSSPGSITSCFTILVFPSVKRGKHFLRAESKRERT
uniref:Uncharacterized protein n=1 Tax=Papio anubis TaxID=9555 RepID=A0A8I5R1F5_PAPAN